MANKPFAIQDAELKIGGVSLQAGTTGVVIPGVTQATDYFVEAVDESNGSNPDTFGSNSNAVTVIDNADYVYRSGGAQPSGDYASAGYSVDELDDGEIGEINVENQGIFLTADKTRAEASNMWATTTPTPFVSFDPLNWTQIPFRPKMRAGAVANVGGGGSGDRLTNGDYQVVLGSSGNITIPKNTTISVPGSTDEDRYGGDINITGQRGYGNWSTEGNAGWGSSIYIRSGDGGENNISDEGGEGGEVWIRSGDGQAGENGGKVSLIAGSAKWNNSGSAIYGGNVFVTAGNATEDASGFGRGGNINISAGEGDQSDGSVNINTVGGDFTWTFDPEGVLTIPSSGDIKRSGVSVLGGGSTSYTPDDTDNWNEPTINTISAALDELAARVTALQNFEIDGGNANTPALGELLIDGNGA